MRLGETTFLPIQHKGENLSMIVNTVIKVKIYL